MCKIPMKLIILGKELSFLVEYELFSESDFGFNAKVVFTKESVFAGEVHTYHNLTEVHNRFKSIESHPQIAFESHIHWTGCTRYIHDIQSVEVTNATKLHKKY